MGPRLHESYHLAPFRPGRGFTQPRAHLVALHSTSICSNDLQGTYAIPASADGGIPAPTAASPLPKSPGGGATSGGGEEAHSPPGPDVDDEESMDWWTKYFASVDAMIEASSYVT